MRPTSVGKSGIYEGHRIGKTCNLTYFRRVTFVTALSRRHRLRSCGLREAPSGHFATGAAEGPSERRRKPMKSPIARSSDNLLTVLELDG
jgi:hypothetical protein